ncbi:hypothetical protein HKD37_03G007472 [Glycine soja]
MFKPTGDKVDVSWNWNNLKDKNNRKSVTCDFCQKTSTGGISGARRHQLQIKGDVDSCKKVSEDVKLEMIYAYEKKIAETAAYTEATQEEDDEEEDGIQEIARLKSGKRPPTTSNETSSTASKKRTTNKKGPLDFLFSKQPEESIKLNGITFNVAKSKSFKLMIQAIGTYGPHLKPPSYHELRVPLFKKELEYTKGLLTGHEEKRIKYGCSIMSDGWTDRKNRTLIDFLANCSLGTQFVRSVDASEYMKTDGWLKSKAAKEPKGKKATDVLMPSFWNDVVYTLKAMGPLAKEVIQRAFNNNEGKYKDILAIIDKRWDCQLHHPLHAADYYLNPMFFYTNPNIYNDNEVVDGLYKCIDRLSEDDNFVIEVHKQLLVYKRARERFGMTVAMKARTEISPTEWWKLCGGKTPHLQTIAIKILSLTCSSSGCERNWSTFEHIHSKKRSRLEHQKLQDLVYVKYNQDLLDRFECHDVIHPIALNDIDDNNEWLLGELEGEEAVNDLVFDDDDDLN